MRVLRAHRRLASWIAALAMLLASLAPSLSHALASADASAWAEVCTAQGARWVADAVEDGADGTAPPSTAHHVFEHCPFCSIHAPAIGMPPSPESAPLSIEGHDEFPPAFHAAPRRLHAWASALPRAPPQCS